MSTASATTSDRDRYSWLILLDLHPPSTLYPGIPPILGKGYPQCRSSWSDSSQVSTRTPQGPLTHSGQYPQGDHWFKLVHNATHSAHPRLCVVLDLVPDTHPPTRSLVFQPAVSFQSKTLKIADPAPQTRCGSSFKSDLEKIFVSSNVIQPLETGSRTGSAKIFNPYSCLVLSLNPPREYHFEIINTNNISSTFQSDVDIITLAT